MKNFNKQIQQWAESEVPDVLDKVLQERPFLDKAPIKKPRWSWRFAPLATVFSLLLVLALVLSQNTQPLEASSVYFDFDTALEFRVDDNDHIIDILGSNASGTALALLLKETTAWQNIPLEIFVETLFTEAQRQGFLTDETPVMLGFRGPNTDQMDQLRSRLVERMNNLPAQARGFTDIYEQDLSQPVAPSNDAPQNPVRDGLINALLAIDDSLDAATLEQLPLGQLIQLARSKGINVNSHPGMRP